jgi:hypothetical protein
MKWAPAIHGAPGAAVNPDLHRGVRRARREQIELLDR